jgi:hypothetical protein
MPQYTTLTAMRMENGERLPCAFAPADDQRSMHYDRDLRLTQSKCRGIIWRCDLHLE